MAGTVMWQWKLLRSLHSLHLSEEIVKRPILAKKNELISTGITLWRLHKLAGKEQSPKSTKFPMILVIVLMSIGLEKFSFATVFVN